ncbi:molybdate/tungstate transport system permease protein [Izhakiella capsodis]|uniref:Molybdate/tungstate transport system permease protein n=1 Tax=Izhakiella capsodis TaxID=1367852 RepID=A0A1I4V9W0_9GAMM|nr:molybdate/tungstate transport system permease protein [Izhakiella capsodis]
MGWLSLPAILLLSIPFLTLVSVTPWHHLQLAWGDNGSILTSMTLGLLALGIIIVIGTPAAWWLSRSRERKRLLGELLVMIPLLTPPLAMGILLVSAFGPYGVIGHWLTVLGMTLVNNPAAFVLAQVYGALPYFIVVARSAFATVPDTILEAGHTLGGSDWACFRRLTLPLALPGLASAVSLAWVRAVGEFGIVMIFAYFPQGIPVKLYINLQNDGVDAVYTLLWVLLIVTLPLPIACYILSKKTANE